MATEDDVVAELIRLGQTVATAESLTAGLVCVRLTDVPGSSAAVVGGLIVYSTELKASLAGVDQQLLDCRGAVHPEVAAQLAEGARIRCGADWGLGLTGVAGPAGQDGVSPGTVHVGLSGPGVRDVRTLWINGDRHTIRHTSVTSALGLLWEHLQEHSGEHSDHGSRSPLA